MRFKDPLAPDVPRHPTPGLFEVFGKVAWWTAKQITRLLASQTSISVFGDSKANSSFFHDKSQSLNLMEAHPLLAEARVIEQNYPLVTPQIVSDYLKNERSLNPYAESKESSEIFSWHKAFQFVPVNYHLPLVTKHSDMPSLRGSRDLATICPLSISLPGSPGYTENSNYLFTVSLVQTTGSCLAGALSMTLTLINSAGQLSNPDGSGLGSSLNIVDGSGLTSNSFQIKFLPTIYSTITASILITASTATGASATSTLLIPGTQIRVPLTSSGPLTLPTSRVNVATTSVQPAFTTVNYNAYTLQTVVSAPYNTWIQVTNSQTGLLNVLAIPGLQGTYSIPITVSNVLDATNTLSYTWPLTVLDLAPTISSIFVANIPYGQSLNQTLALPPSASSVIGDPDGLADICRGAGGTPPCAIGLLNAPSWWSLNNVTGVFTGLPPVAPAAGSTSIYTGQVYIKDLAGVITSTPVSVAVVPSLSFTTTTLSQITQGATTNVTGVSVTTLGIPSITISMNPSAGTLQVTPQAGATVVPAAGLSTSGTLTISGANTNAVLATLKIIASAISQAPVSLNFNPSDSLGQTMPTSSTLLSVNGILSQFTPTGVGVAAIVGPPTTPQVLRILSANFNNVNSVNGVYWVPVSVQIMQGAVTVATNSAPNGWAFSLPNTPTTAEADIVVTAPKDSQNTSPYVVKVAIQAVTASGAPISGMSNLTLSTTYTVNPPQIVASSSSTLPSVGVGDTVSFSLPAPNVNPVNSSTIVQRVTGFPVGWSQDAQGVITATGLVPGAVSLTETDCDLFMNCAAPIIRQVSVVATMNVLVGAGQQFSYIQDQNYPNAGTALNAVITGERNVTATLTNTVTNSALMAVSNTLGVSIDRSQANTLVLVGSPANVTTCLRSLAVSPVAFFSANFALNLVVTDSVNAPFSQTWTWLGTAVPTPITVLNQTITTLSIIPTQTSATQSLPTFVSHYSGNIVITGQVLAANGSVIPGFVIAINQLPANGANYGGSYTVTPPAGSQATIGGIRFTATRSSDGASLQSAITPLIVNDVAPVLSTPMNSISAFFGYSVNQQIPDVTSPAGVSAIVRSVKLATGGAAPTWMQPVFDSVSAHWFIRATVPQNANANYALVIEYDDGYGGVVSSPFSWSNQVALQINIANPLPYSENQQGVRLPSITLSYPGTQPAVLTVSVPSSSTSFNITVPADSNLVTTMAYNPVTGNNDWTATGEQADINAFTALGLPISFANNFYGPVQFQVTANNGIDPVEPKFASLTVAHVNQPPVMGALPDLHCEAGQSCVAAVPPGDATDPDTALGDVLTPVPGLVPSCATYTLSTNSYDLAQCPAGTYVLNPGVHDSAGLTASTIWNVVKAPPAAGAAAAGTNIVDEIKANAWAFSFVLILMGLAAAAVAWCARDRAWKLSQRKLEDSLKILDAYHKKTPVPVSGAMLNTKLIQVCDHMARGDITLKEICAFEQMVYNYTATQRAKGGAATATLELDENVQKNLSFYAESVATQIQNKIIGEDVSLRAQLVHALLIYLKLNHTANDRKQSIIKKFEYINYMQIVKRSWGQCLSAYLCCSSNALGAHKMLLNEPVLKSLLRSNLALLTQLLDDNSFAKVASKIPRWQWTMSPMPDNVDDVMETIRIRGAYALGDRAVFEGLLKDYELCPLDNPYKLSALQDALVHLEACLNDQLIELKKKRVELTDFIAEHVELNTRIKRGEVLNTAENQRYVELGQWIASHSQFLSTHSVELKQRALDQVKVALNTKQGIKVVIGADDAATPVVPVVSARNTKEARGRRVIDGAAGRRLSVYNRSPIPKPPSRKAKEAVAATPVRVEGDDSSTGSRDSFDSGGSGSASSSGSGSTASSLTKSRVKLSGLFQAMPLPEAATSSVLSIRRVSRVSVVSAFARETGGGDASYAQPGIKASWDSGHRLSALGGTGLTHGINPMHMQRRQLKPVLVTSSSDSKIDHSKKAGRGSRVFARPSMLARPGAEIVSVEAEAFVEGTNPLYTMVAVGQ